MRHRRAARGRLLLAGVGALLAGGLLSACASPVTGLQREAATQFQARVLEVTQAASRNDPASALQALQGLESDLSAAQAKGQLSEERRRSITAVASTVRADLNEAVAAQQAAAKAAEEARTAAQQAAAQTASPDASAPSAPGQVPAPAQGGNKGSTDKANGKK